MLKKTSILTLIFAMSFLVFTGFGCKGLSKTEQQAIQPVTLEYWTVFDDVDALNATIAKWRIDRPHITVNVRQLRIEELYPRLVEALAEDRGPDIISIRNRWVKSFQSKLAPMPVGARDTTVQVIKNQFSTETKINPRDYALPTVLDIERNFVQTVKSDVVVEGKVYGLPLSLDALAIYYNKDILDRAGVAEPPKTWEEFQEAVKKVTKYDRTSGKVTQSGVAIGAGANVPGVDDILYVLYRQSNVDFVSRSGQAVFNYAPRNNDISPAMSVMNFYTDFANTARDTYSWNKDLGNALDSFVQGKAGFFFGYSYHYPLIKARAPQLNFEVMPMLQLNNEQPVNVANYWIQSVVAKSKNQNEAWNLINSLTYTKLAKEYLDLSKRPTALRALINEQKEKIELAPFISQVLVAENWYRGRNYEAALKAIQDMVDEFNAVPLDNDKVMQMKQNVLNRGATKVNQTL